MVLQPGNCTLQDAQGALPLPWKLRLSAEVLATYGRVRWLLKRKDLSATLADLRGRGTPPDAYVPDEEIAWQVGERLGWITVRTLRPVPGDSRCLMRSLVLTRMMARRGIRTTLIIGAQTGSGFAAHAWVERQGLPLLSPGSDYGRLAEL